jgi:hypothetical protein
MSVPQAVGRVIGGGRSKDRPRRQPSVPMSPTLLDDEDEGREDRRSTGIEGRSKKDTKRRKEGREVGSLGFLEEGQIVDVLA